MKKGILAVVDAPDGAGKKTQVKMLANRLRDEGHEVETLDFPHDANHIGALIREGLNGKRGDFMHLDSRIASLLYAADRFESKPLIEGWLAEGKIVLLDRYVTSNMIHQGAKLESKNEREELVRWLDKTEHGVFGIPRPDVVFYLNVPFDVRSALLAARGEPDLAEADVEHQRRADQCASEIGSIVPNWVDVNCANDSGGIRAPMEINLDLLSMIRNKFPHL